MESMDYWRLCEELSIVQAALLVAESDPAECSQYVETWAISKRPFGYEAAKTAILNGLRKDSIRGRIVPLEERDLNGNYVGPVEGSVDVAESTVEVESLRAWLKGRGMRTGFFFPTATDDPDYLDQNNLRYAPKLAAAVRAWQSVTDGGGKSAKQALTKWLREHAADFDLSNDDGNPNETGIEEVAKVANWHRSGGAPKTPGG
jgi:hypothetical protein